MIDRSFNSTLVGKIESSNQDYGGGTFMWGESDQQ